MIFVNTLAITAMGFFQETSPAGNLLYIVDFACITYFIIEAALKIYSLGWRQYWSLGWNRFDFLVVLLCVPTLAKPLVGNVMGLSLGPILRTGRLFRLFRLLRFIPKVETLTNDIKRALRASIGIILGLVLITLIFALSSHVLFADRAPEEFGNPALAFYSIFQILTLEGWDEYPRSLENDGDPPAWLLGIRLFFMLAVVVCGLLGFSLANAVFIDEMTMDNNNQLEAKVETLIEEVRALREVVAGRDGPGADG